MSPSQSAITQWGWDFHTLPGGIDPVDLCFRPRAVGVVEIWREFLSGDDTLSSLGAAGPRRWPEGRWLHDESHPISNIQWVWGFHTLRGGIDPGDLRFRPRVAGIVEIWKDFKPGDETLSSPGAAGPQRWP